MTPATDVRIDPVDVEDGPESQAPAVSSTQERKAARTALKEIRKPVEGSIRLGCVIGALGALAGLAPFIGLVGVVDALLDRPIDRGELIAWCVFIVGGLVARAVLSFIGLGITHFADVRLQAILRRQIVAHLGRVPLGWFTDQSSGRVRKAAMGDVHDLHQMVAHHAVEMTAAITMPIAGIAYLFLLDWRLALLALAPIPVYAALYAWMMRDFTEQMQKMDDGNARISSAGSPSSRPSARRDRPTGPTGMRRRTTCPHSRRGRARCCASRQ